MEDAFANWSEQEKEAFFGILEIEHDIKALKNYLQNINKVSPT